MLSVSDQTESLLAATKKLLAERGELSLRQIASESDVGVEWLRKFDGGHISNPDVRRVEKVYEFLKAWRSAERFRPNGAEARAG